MAPGTLGTASGETPVCCGSDPFSPSHERTPPGLGSWNCNAELSTTASPFAWVDAPEARKVATDVAACEELCELCRLGGTAAPAGDKTEVRLGDGPVPDSRRRTQPSPAAICESTTDERLLAPDAADSAGSNPADPANMAKTK